MKPTTAIANILAASVLCSVANVYAVSPISIDNANKTQLVIYADQQALVHQQVDVSTAKGKPMMITGLSSSANINSLQVTSKSGQSGTLQWQDKRFSPERALSVMQGSKVELYGSALQAPESGTLLSWNNGYALVETDNKRQYLVRDNDPNVRIRFLTQYPLASNPIVTLSTANHGPLDVQYRLDNIGYQMRYRMQVNLKTQQATLQQQATVRNDTTQNFKQADVTLAIGDRGNANENTYERSPRVMLASSRSIDGMNRRSATAGALRYTPMSTAINLPAYSVTRVEMAHWSNIAVTNSLQLDVRLRGVTVGAQPKLPTRILSWKAPILLSAGELALYETDTQGHVRWSGSSRIATSAKGLTMRVPLGQVYQVPVTLTRLSNTQSQGVNTQKWQVKVQNSTSKKVTLVLNETDTKLLGIASGKAQSNRSVTFSIPANSSQTFTLTARYDARKG